MFRVNKKGFTLVEMIAALGIFVLFAVGIYGGIQMIFKVVYTSRIRILETAILNEQIEIIRNIGYDDLGSPGGSPPGLLQRQVTTTRNGIDFLITRTIRNIDDPFDGLIGGTPNDTAPADYKLAAVDVICTRCGQRSAVSMSTQVGPKYLESSANHGALFIKVFDAQADTILGADVHITATSTSSTIDIADTTDINGMLRLVDLPAGIAAYTITTTKPGYTMDMTITPSALIPHPVRLPASVVAQDVTLITFSIDRVASISTETTNAECIALPNTPVGLKGTKLWGTVPDVFMVSTTATTDSAGLYTWNNLIWDSYRLSASGYNVRGSIPALPVVLGPGVNQPVQLILGPDTTRSLVVVVYDAVVGQPLSNAIVTVTSSNYSVSANTGVGYVHQTDWSDGAGQELMSDTAKYWSDDGNIDTNNPAGDVKLRLVGNQYVNSGVLESSAFDLGLAPQYVNMLIDPGAQTPETGVNSLRFQLATSTVATSSSWTYVGPDGTEATFYTPSEPVIFSGNNGGRYLRYKAYLSTDSPSSTPVLSGATITYTNQCTPPGQAYFSNLANQTYSVTVAKAGYQTHQEDMLVTGDMLLSVDMVSL